jgi:hypothetical protein
MKDIQDMLKDSNPESYSLDYNMTIAIKKLKETGEHHSVFQLSSNINPVMIVENYSLVEELETYGYYELWNTKGLTSNS